MFHEKILSATLAHSGKRIVTTEREKMLHSQFQPPLPIRNNPILLKLTYLQYFVYVLTIVVTSSYIEAVIFQYIKRIASLQSEDNNSFKILTDYFQHLHTN
jgi:hypothetical protein